MKNKNSTTQKETSKYLGASDIVNGTASFYTIKEKEMESALNDIYKEIGYKDME